MNWDLIQDSGTQWNGNETEQKMPIMVGSVFSSYDNSLQNTSPPTNKHAMQQNRCTERTATWWKVHWLQRSKCATQMQEMWQHLSTQMQDTLIAEVQKTRFLPLFHLQRGHLNVGPKCARKAVSQSLLYTFLQKLNTMKLLRNWLFYFSKHNCNYRAISNLFLHVGATSNFFVHEGRCLVVLLMFLQQSWNSNNYILAKI